MMRNPTEQNQGGRLPASGELPPRITVRSGLLARMHEYVSRSLGIYGHPVEVGGMLVGELSNNHGHLEFQIQEFIEAGPNADCSRQSVLFDADYQSRTLARLRFESPRLINLGCIHVHPEGGDQYSHEDLRADMEAVRLSDTKALVIGIITFDPSGADASSLYFGAMKFDFYVLTERSGFNYMRVRPTLEEAAPASTNHAPANLSTLLASAASRSSVAWPRLLKDKRRLVAEVRAMQERYGGRATLRFAENRLYWEYTVTESDRRFPIQLRYPRDYPFHPPRIFSMLDLPFSPHQMPGNELCWTDRLGQCDWNPARDTAVVGIHAAHRWFSCLLVYLSLGKWPQGADHETRQTVS